MLVNNYDLVFVHLLDLKNGLWYMEILIIDDIII